MRTVSSRITGTAKLIAAVCLMTVNRGQGLPGPGACPTAWVFPFSAVYSTDCRPVVPIAFEAASITARASCADVCCHSNGAAASATISNVLFIVSLLLLPTADRTAR